MKKWYIGIGANALKVTDMVTLDSGIMYFTSYDNCLAFFRWLKKVKFDPKIGLISGDYQFVPTSVTLTDLISKQTIEKN